MIVGDLGKLASFIKGIIYIFAFAYLTCKTKKKNKITRDVLDIILICSVIIALSWKIYFSNINNIWSYFFSINSLRNDSWMIMINVISGLFLTLLFYSSRQSPFRNIIKKFVLVVIVYYISAILHIIFDQNDIVGSTIVNFLRVWFYMYLPIIATINPIESKEVDEEVIIGDSLELYIPAISFTILVINIHLMHRDIYVVIMIINSMIIFLKLSLMFRENKLLLKKYHELNSALGEIISARTNELSQSRQRYRSLFDMNPNAICSLDLDGIITSINPVFIELFEVDIKNNEVIVGLDVMSFMDESNQLKIKEHFELAKEGRRQNFDISFKLDQVKNLELKINLMPIIVNNIINGIYCVVEDVSELKKSNEKIEYMAYHDPLTNIGNRNYFLKEFSDTISKAEEAKRMPVLFFIDLDGFKYVNDTYGHFYGDKVLLSVSSRLKEVLKNSGQIFRQGGDEFTILVYHCEERKNIEILVQQILDTIRMPSNIFGDDIKVSASIGIVRYPSDGKNLDELMKKVDTSMYYIKERKKDGYYFYEDIEV